MKYIDRINSSRGAENYPSLQIVFEWEDAISEATGLPVSHGHSEYDRWNLRLEKYHLVWLRDLFTGRCDCNLRFVMNAYPYRRAHIDRNTIPVFIDFWLTDSEIPVFIRSYRHCPLVLVTNREVYDKLVAFDPEFPVEHWPLSFPDKYAFRPDNINGKDFEFGIYGRPNPFFIKLLEEYSQKHPDFTYIMSRGTEHNREFYTNKGEFISKGDSRESYLNMIRRTRISCYSTPGCDSSKIVRAPYNQVTPRLFEMLCNGCSVLGHYPKDSADVLWYELESIVPNVDTYEEFEQQLDIMRRTPADAVAIDSFMKRHYTKSIVPLLVDILKRHNILLR